MKAGIAQHSANADLQMTAIITEDTISTIGTSIANRQQTNTMSYTVVGGNARLVVIDATMPDGNSFHMNIRLVEGGIAMETPDCQANPEVCEREREQQATSTFAFSTGSEPQPRQTRPGPTQPQWIYFRPFQLPRQPMNDLSNTQCREPFGLDRPYIEGLLANFDGHELN
ncbi:MAG: hypothetical protein O7G86_07450 [Gammaproteobacteria bacterium]|nr:hypothetical protein [Gammaproteobacteria bacterium]